MFNFKKLVSLQYLFQIDSFMLYRSDKLFLLIGAVAIVLAAVLKIAAKTAPSPVDQKYRGKFFSLLLTVGIWELAWFACRYENIRFFGTHFIALIGLVVGLIWLVSIAVSMYRHYTSEKQSWEKEQVRLKYLPSR